MTPSGACHRCGAAVAADRVGVRDVCGRCGGYLYCCKNCALHQPGLRNDCREPRTELIADREAMNFCDDFRLAAGRAAGAPAPGEARAALDRLFRRG